MLTFNQTLKTHNVALINESTAASDAMVSGYVAALQEQVSQNFAKCWFVDARLSFFPKGKKPSDPTIWQLVVLDNSDQADALGYHDLTATGQPMGKVFAETDLQDGTSLSVTISHELLEMLADPYINFIVPEGTGKYTMVEVCDAVEEDDMGYKINGVLVSDFCEPAYFGFPGPHYDWLHHLNKGFPELLPGGYISVYQNGTWTQLTADLASGGKSKRQQRSHRTPIIHGSHPIKRSTA